MNVQAEIIEQTIQHVNRTLSCVYAGSDDENLERHELKQVDAAIFGHDKFAFEMVHYLKSADVFTLHDKGQDVKAQWERQFAIGLEQLLVTLTSSLLLLLLPLLPPVQRRDASSSALFPLL